MNNEFIEIPLIAAILRENQANFEAEFPERMLFATNEVRKSGEHTSLCLTVADGDEKPFCVVKFQNKKTDIATLVLRTEYEVIKDLERFTSLKDSLPKALGVLEYEGRFIPMYSFEPGEMLFKRLYDTHGIFYSELFTRPLDLLFAFNQESHDPAKTISKDFIAGFKDRLFANFGGKYSYLTVPINSIWSRFEQDINTLVGIPLVYTHNDFNAVNIAVGDDKSSFKIFDWEDAQAEYPIIFDFFYFVLMFLWYLFDDRFSRVKRKDITENCHKIIELASDYINRYMATFQIHSKDQINALFVMFILGNIIIDTEPKRESEEFLISRWVYILSKLGGELYLLTYIQEQEAHYLENFKENTSVASTPLSHLGKEVRL